MITRLVKTTSSLVVPALVCICLAACSPSEQPTQDSKDQFTALFDGKTLNGWRTVGGDATFSVDNGEILGVHGPGKNTFLRTEKTFGDFILRLEMRYDVPGNSGIMFRANQRDGNGRTFGYQYELDEKERAWSAGIYDEARRGWLFPLEGDAFKEQRKALKMNDWNKIKIQVVGGSIKTWLNDMPISDLVDAMSLEGFVALQVHAGGNAQIRWRNIEIKELGKHQWATEQTKRADAWAARGFDAVESDGQNISVLRRISKSDIQLLRLREPLENFAIQFDLPVCDKPAMINLRQWRNGGGPEGLKLQLTKNRASVHLADKALTEVVAIDVKKPQDTQHITITAVGDQVTFAVNRQHVGRVVGKNIPARGVFSIEPADCGSDRITLGQPALVDLNTGDEPRLLYQTVEAPPAPFLSPEQAKDSFRIAPGFKLELVAAEPLVEDPVAMAWDEAGSLFVVELRGYMPDAFGKGEHDPVGVVAKLEDTDGDGQMDKRTVFLDKLIHPRAIAVVDEGVLIGEPPNLWLCRDTTGNGVCDSKRSVGKYGLNDDGGNGGVEHRENGLLEGLDGWLYNSKSSRRLKLDNGKLVEEKTLFRGQWGITQDNAGRMLYNTNSRFVLADLFPADPFLRDGRGPKIPGLSLKVVEKEEVFSIRVNPGVNRAYRPGVIKDDGRLNRPTAVSGLVSYRGDQFPPEYNNDVFIPEPGGNAVIQLRLNEQGIDLNPDHRLYPDETWGKREFLASTDERFRPVDAKVGPDGALYIIDMYRGILQDIVYMTEELREQVYARGLEEPVGRGRIWRVVREDSPVRRQAPQLDKADISSLIATLGHANGWHRDTAKRLLIAKKAKLKSSAISAIRKIATSENAPGAVHALWTLSALGKLDNATVLAAMDHQNANVAIQALRAGGQLVKASDIINKLSSISDESARLRQQLVISLRHHNTQPNVLATLQSFLEKNRQSDYMRVAVVAAARGQEFAFLKRLLASKQWSDQNKSNHETTIWLTAEANRTLRGDVTVGKSASKPLQAMLSYIEKQQGEKRWVQIAMLEGLQASARDKGFKPAVMSTRHSVLATDHLKATDPLWEARRKGQLAFTWPGDPAANVEPLSKKQKKLAREGRDFYNRVCTSCHGGDGRGSAGLAPALAMSTWVTGSPDWLARIVLQGLVGPIVVDGEQWDGAMPPHLGMAGFDDEMAAGLLTYLRRSWGNNQSAITVEFINQVISETADRKTPWTVAELQALPVKK
jgi:glucose/arabinose dehydrogenase/mono/diheme cytochrome c family protein